MAVLSLFIAGASAATGNAAVYNLYVNNTSSGTISEFQATPGGLLSPWLGVVPAGNVETHGALSPDGHSLYVAHDGGPPVADNTGLGEVVRYAVDSCGALSPDTSFAAPSVVGPEGMAFSPDGKSLYVAGSGAPTISGTFVPGGVWQFDIAANGGLSPKNPPKLSAGGHPLAVAVSHDGANVYVLSDAIYQFHVDASGALVPNTPASVAGTGPGMALSPDGRHLYLTAFGPTSPLIREYDVDSDGVLTPASEAPLPSPSFPAAITVSPNAANVYVTDVNDDLVWQYSVGADGALGALAQPVMTGRGPSWIAVSPDGSTVYVTNIDDRGPSGLSEYTVGSNGALTPRRDPAASTGTYPIGLAIGRLINLPAGCGASEPGLNGSQGSSTSTLGTSPKGAPRIGNLSIAPSAFRAAGRGPSVSRAARMPIGGRIMFTLSSPASVSFRVQRQVQGRQSGHKCKPLSRQNRGKRVCLLYSPIPGGFIVSGRGGWNGFRFSGRLSGRMLSPARYVLNATPIANNSRGNTSSTTFKIER